jgi:hypothetical protein
MELYRTGRADVALPVFYTVNGYAVTACRATFSSALAL